MTARQLFQQQTIAELAKVTSLERAVAGQQEPVPETVPASRIQLSEFRISIGWPIESCET